MSVRSSARPRVRGRPLNEEIDGSTHRVATVWDCFMFGGELDLLEYRLAELGDVVDRFVICESERTHSGLPKPLHYRDNRDRYARWSKQIVHVVAELPAQASDAWRREEQQRRSIRDVLRDRAREDDVIIMGDVDEFIDRDTLASLSEHCYEPVSLGMPHATYFANWWMPQAWSAPPVFARGSQLDEPLVRSLLGDAHEQWDGFQQRIVDGCGVHVSYSGGADAVRKKFLGHPDTYLGEARFHAEGFIEWCIAYSVQFEGWGVMRRLQPDELPPLLRRMHGRAPQLFNFTRAPSLLKRHALSGYARVRNSKRVPQRVVDWLDEHPAWVTMGPAAPVCLAIEGARHVRRRFFKRPEPPFFIPLESSLRERRELKHPRWRAPIHLSLDEIARPAR